MFGQQASWRTVKIMYTYIVKYRNEHYSIYKVSISTALNTTVASNFAMILFKTSIPAGTLDVNFVSQ